MPITPKAPKFPESVTPAAVTAYKMALREYDALRIATGAATPSQVQSENSFFPMDGVYSTSFRRVSTPTLRRLTAGA